MFMSCITRMFEAQKKDVVFIETVMALRKQYHTCVHAIPLSDELGEVAPMYFKKAILESDTEWSQNKKLVDTRKKGIRSSVK